MSYGNVPIHGVRAGRSRDRRGRGIRGPRSLPGPLSASRLPFDTNRQKEFDNFGLAALNSMARTIQAAGVSVEVAVESAPLLPESWDDPVPASILTKDGSTHTIVIYRLPITQRAESSAQVLSLVWEVLSHRVAEIVGVHPDDLLDDL